MATKRTTKTAPKAVKEEVKAVEVQVAPAAQVEPVVRKK